MAATSRSHQQALKHTVRLFSPPRKAEGAAGPPAEELDEADVWCVQSASKPDERLPVHRSPPWKRTGPHPHVGSASGSSSFSNSTFDESEDDEKTSAPWSRSAWKKIKTNVGSGSGSGSRLGSIPVKIPDRSKIMLHEYGSMNCYEELGFEEEEEEATVPPHEVVMRRRAASLSVVEGIGRTLKGRDLSRVRNAIWAKTGFQD